ncbi:trypsin-2-like [Culex pipiens pallens]|uniref:trypsin-2-like n=1 Tax=Culex pipiens pallens TaxID=42434 RepID=UPI001954CEB1|nr:trypsin-2-like [Culex pipiens pallens]
MNKIIIGVICAVLAYVNGASINPTNSRKIVGGFQIDISEVPYQVSLQWYGRHACGGSIISERWILTAAHCMDDNLDPATHQVRVGSTEHADGGRLVPVLSIHVHPNYDDRDLQFDYTLLELDETLEFGETVQPIELATEEPKDGELSLVSGWGQTQNEEESRDLLRAVVVPIVDRTRCGEAYRVDFETLPESMICAGDWEQGGRDACYGDSGGPLVVDGKLAGIVSTGDGCAKPGAPGIYANVVTVREWIREVSGV